MPSEKVVLRKKLIRPLFDLVVTDKNVYICQKKCKFGRDNQLLEDKLIPIQEIQDMSLIDEGINILLFQIMALLVKEDYYLPCPPPPPPFAPLPPLPPPPPPLAPPFAPLPPPPHGRPPPPP